VDNGLQPSIREEGRIYANYIQAFYPGKRIVALCRTIMSVENYSGGWKTGSVTSPDDQGPTSPTISQMSIWETHVSILKRSGAEIFVFAGVPANAAKVIRIAADLNWHPVFILNHMASSIATALKPAGSENALGVITATFLKDANDPAWKDEQATKDWQAFFDKYNRAGGKDDSAAIFRLPRPPRHWPKCSNSAARTYRARTS